MSRRPYTGLFVSEGTSDLPLADVIETLFVDRGLTVWLSKPDFTLLRKVPKDVESRVRAGMKLLGDPVDVVVVHIPPVRARRPRRGAAGMRRHRVGRPADRETGGLRFLDQVIVTETAWARVP